jgi:peptide chain release factor 2
VLVTPKQDDNNMSEEDIQIPKSDLKIDVMRSSGKGGQNVNKTESAVRVTHIPTGIVVKVTQERSQLYNRRLALSILVSKLHQMELEKMDNKRSELHENMTSNAFGSQIRSYTLTPYQLVKDSRTQVSSSHVQDMFDGGKTLQLFLDARI